MSPRHLVAAAMLVFASTPLFGQSVKAGIEAWQRADYSSAVSIWRPLADAGDADAQFNLGQAYRLGRGVPLNLALAKGWFGRAAEAGHLDAETTLGLLLFQNGDQAEGLKWLRRAAEQGEPRALLVYGTALYNGDGVTQDRLLGYAYVSRAAQQGLVPARETLAQLDTLLPVAERQKAIALSRAVPNGRATPSASAARVAEAPRPDRAPKDRPTRSRPAAPKPATAFAKSVPEPAGAWRIQLGAFAQHGSAQALYEHLSRKSALAGKNAFYIPAGAMTRLQVGPFISKAAAAAACGSLGAACFPVPAK